MTLKNSPYDLVVEAWSDARKAYGFQESDFINRFLACMKSEARVCEDVHEYEDFEDFKDHEDIENIEDIEEPLSQGRRHVLDLGCGTGEPVGQYLLDKKLKLTGVDASKAMITHFKRACPDAIAIHGDMREVTLLERYDGAVAWDSVFHLPRKEHARLFQRVHQWLKPKAPFLLSLGGSAGEFNARMFGESFFYSGYEPDVSLEMIRHAGFLVRHWEIDDPSSRGHMAVLAQRI